MKSVESLDFVRSIYPTAWCFRHRYIGERRVRFSIIFDQYNSSKRKTTQQAAWNWAALEIKKQMLRKLES